MKPSRDELTIITGMLLLAPDCAPVNLERFQGMFDRPSRLRASILSLARARVILHDPYQGSARLLRAAAWQLLNCGPGHIQAEMFTEERPLDAAHVEIESRISRPVIEDRKFEAGSEARTSPNSGDSRFKRGPRENSAPPDAPPLSRTTRDKKILSSSTRVEDSELQTRNSKLRPAYWDDPYIQEKLALRRRLKDEFSTGRTPMARRFEALHQQDPDRARELLGLAVTLPCGPAGRQPNPAAWLNIALRAEGVTYA